VSSIFF